MRKHPFVIFLLTLAILITGAISFIQSEGFARVLKGFVARHLPSDLGIEGDFSDLSVGLFPPSVSIRNPKVELSNHNLINLPPGSSINAKRIDLRFRLFQMFSGNIRINEVAVVDGVVKLVLHRNESKKSSGTPIAKELNWDELFQIRAEAVGLENTEIHVEFADSPFTTDLVAEQLRLAQWSGKGGLGYELRADLKDINSSAFKAWVPPSGISRLSAIAHVNAEGVQIDDISTMIEGLDVHLAGDVRGNVLNAKTLPFDGSIIVKADIAAASKFLLKAQPEISPQGTVEFNSKIKGNLLKLEETLRADGKLVGENIQYAQYSADRVVVEAAYIASVGGKGGEVSLTRAVITGKETPRVGGHRAGSGGKVEIGAFHYVIGSHEPIAVPLKLEHAHLQWIGAAALKSTYPMDTRLDGSILATLRPGTPWSLQADLNLNIPEFQLDNQRLGLEKPMHRILRIPNLKIDGPITVTPSGVSIAGLALSLPHTKLIVDGSVTGKGGFELTGQGKASLADIVELSETPIAGDGTLKVHVHGPSSRVFIDFDSDLKDAVYLRLKLGSFAGRITWDDDPQYLLFDHVKALKGQTDYIVDGKLDLGKSETIDLDVTFPNGNIFDVAQIFESFTKDFWWFPKTITGPVKGVGKLTGGLSMDELVINSEMSGNNWEYLGERFRIVNLKGGYDKGKYQITDVHGVKQSGKFAGHISYDTEDRFDWALKTQDLQVTDIDHLAQLDVPFRGDIQFETRGSGRQNALLSSSSGSVSNLSVRGSTYLPSHFLIRTENGVASGSGIALGDQASFDFVYGMNPGFPSTVRFDVQHFDFSPILLLLNPKLMQDPQLLGQASGSVKLAFRSGEVERASGNISVNSYLLEKTGTVFKLSHPVSTKITDGEFSIQDLAISGAGGNVTLNLRGRPSSLNGSVGGDLDLGIIEFITPTISKATGSADLDFTIEGILKAPKVYGAAEIDNGTLRVPAVDSSFENLTGTLQLRQNVVTLQNVESDLGGGRVKIGGTVTLYPDRYPSLALKGDLSGNRIRVYPFQYVRVKGPVGVNGEERPYLVDGSMSVDSALTKEKVLGGKREESLKSLQYTPSSTSQGSTNAPLFKLKIDVNADHGLMVQNDLFDAELKAHITVVNTLEAPRIIGTADLIQGKMKFKDRVFQIQSANAVFDNPNVINPQFNLTATTDVSNTKVSFYASGRLDKTHYELTSNPSMSESEIISLLALGNLSSDASKRISGQSTESSAVQQGEAASLLLQSMDFNREVKEKTGFEFQLDEYENTIQGQSIFTRNVNDTTVAPRIIVKRQLGDRVTVSYGSTVGVDVNRQTEANAELHLTQGFSLIGVWDTYEFSDLEQRPTSQSSYGFDFKLQKRFK